MVQSALLMSVSKTLAGVFYTILVLIALFTNICLTIVFVMGYRHFAQRPFYIVARHLLVADFLSLIPQIFVAMAITVLPTDLDYALTTIYDYFLTIETVGQVAMFHFVLLQACSQIAPFLPRSDDIMMQLSSKGTFICMFVWFWNAAFLMLFYMSNCGKVFDAINFYFAYVCDSNESRATIWTAVKIWFAMNMVVAISIYIIGLSTNFRKYRIAMKTTQPYNNPNRSFLHEVQRRRAILIQGLYIAVVTAIRAAVTFGVPTFAQNHRFAMQNDTFAMLMILNNCFAIACIGLHPIIYFMFNERVRKHYTKICYAVLLTVVKRNPANATKT